MQLFSRRCLSDRDPQPLFLTSERNASPSVPPSCYELFFSRLKLYNEVRLVKQDKWTESKQLIYFFLWNSVHIVISSLTIFLVYRRFTIKVGFQGALPLRFFFKSRLYFCLIFHFKLESVVITENWSSQFLGSHFKILAVPWKNLLTFLPGKMQPKKFPFLYRYFQLLLFSNVVGNHKAGFRLNSSRIRAADWEWFSKWL